MISKYSLYIHKSINRIVCSMLFVVCYCSMLWFLLFGAVSGRHFQNNIANLSFQFEDFCMVLVYSWGEEWVCAFLSQLTIKNAAFLRNTLKEESYFQSTSLYPFTRY